MTREEVYKNCITWRESTCPLIEVEPQETETWNGIHGQITAPKGTFEKIWEDAESEDLGDYPDTIHNQFDNMTGSMNL